MRKKILFISNYLYGGGSERVLVFLANKFSENGCDVVILSSHPEKTYPINKKIIIENIYSAHNHFQLIRNIRRKIKEYEPECIISFEYYENICTIFSAIGLKKKIIVSERNDPKKVGGTFFKRIIRNIAYLRCTQLVCQTKDAKLYFPQKIQKKAVIISNPIRRDIPDKYIGERKKTIINVGRLSSQKNQELLIEAFYEVSNLFPEYTLEIFGDGPLRDTLSQKIKELRLQERCFLMGNDINVLERIKDKEIFILTSDYEGMPNALLEAMALGLLCISTDCPCGGPRLLFGEEEPCGILFPVKDKDRLVKILRSTLNNKELFERLTRLQTQRVLIFSEEKIWGEWKKIVF